MPAVGGTRSKGWNMSAFQEMSETGGVDLFAPQGAYMVVPWNGVNYVMFDLTQGARPPASNHFVDIADITDVSVIQALGAALRLDGSQAIANLFGNPGASGSKKRLLAITGKAPGTTVLATKGGTGPGSLQISVLRPRTVAVTIRFFRYLDQSGAQVGTTWKPADAQGILDRMNNIFSSQANISFKLLKAEPLVVNQTFGPVIMDEVYNSTLKPELDKDAEITVFFVGKWAHSKTDAPNASSWFYDKNNVVVLNDKPEHKEVPDIDPFQLTLAHELVHCLGFRPHVKRNHVLMSQDLQSLRIPREVVEVIARH